jgi:calcium-dependent protein kinase
MGCLPSTSKSQKSSIKPNNGSTSLSAGKPSVLSGKKKCDINMDSGCCSVVRQRYKVLDLVGHGKFGVAYKAERRDAPGEFVAIKVIKKNSHLDKNLITEEVKLLEGLNHPNIVKYYEQIQDGPYIFIITEFCSGGELIDNIVSKKKFRESEAAEIIKKLLYALDYCHSKDIAHRDVKPENIMYSSNDSNGELKLIDFGLAKRSTDSLGYQTIVGAPYYVAPEVIDGGYTKACDIWSTGVVLHLLLSGSVAFTGKNTEDIFKSIKKGQVNFDNPVWDKVTPPAKDLLMRLLDGDDSKRPTAAEALQHHWFKEVKTYSEELDLLDSTVISSMKQYQGTLKFQKNCLHAFVKNLKEEEISDLASVFHNVDEGSKGYISTDSLMGAFKRSHPTMDVSNLMSQLDTEMHGNVNYGELVALTLNVKQFLIKEQLWELYQSLDTDDCGYLDIESIKKLLKSNGYTTEEITKIIKSKGIKNESRIVYSQFVNILHSINFKSNEPLFKN